MYLDLPTVKLITGIVADTFTIFSVGLGLILGWKLYAAGMRHFGKSIVEDIKKL
jgi:hypothetical protein